LFDPIDFLISTTLCHGRRKGLLHPTLLLCSPQCKQARAVYLAHHGQPMEPAEDGEHEVCHIATVEADKASQLLREHGGVGGACVAGHIDDATVLADGLVVLMLADCLCCNALEGDKVLLRVKVAWDRVRRGQRPLSQRLREEGPSYLRLQLENGEVALVFGPTGLDAALAASLVGVVRTGKRGGTGGRIEVDDARLERLLLMAYSQRSGPRQIAEAIQTLKRLPGDPSQRLVRLLRDRPRLRRLRRQVQQELTGEA
jgi:hypothetical protein